MTIDISTLLENNRLWSSATRDQDPQFFSRLAAQQSPRYLWIGCSDSRVPANVITGLAPGEVFVHRNISNRVENWDRNILAVLQFAVLHLRVEHIIVCGHHDCGGVRAALYDDLRGPLGDWILPIRRLAEADAQTAKDFGQVGDWVNHVCELNVREQVQVLLDNPYLQEAAALGHRVEVHGWVYSLKDGVIRNLGVSGANIPHPAPAPAL